MRHRQRNPGQSDREQLAVPVGIGSRQAVDCCKDRYRECVLGRAPGHSCPGRPGGGDLIEPRPPAKQVWLRHAHLPIRDRFEDQCGLEAENPVFQIVRNDRRHLIATNARKRLAVLMGVQRAGIRRRTNIAAFLRFHETIPRFLEARQILIKQALQIRNELAKANPPYRARDLAQMLPFGIR